MVFQYSGGAALAAVVLLEHAVRVLHMQQKLLVAHHVASLFGDLEVKRAHCLSNYLEQLTVDVQWMSNINSELVKLASRSYYQLFCWHQLQELFYLRQDGHLLVRIESGVEVKYLVQDVRRKSRFLLDKLRDTVRQLRQYVLYELNFVKRNQALLKELHVFLLQRDCIPVND